MVVPHAVNSVRRHGCCPGAARRCWRLYIHPALGSIPSRSTGHYRRFAARSNMSRAQVDVFSPAARSSSARSASVSRIRNSACFRSSGGFGGRPIFGCFSAMP